MGKSTLLNALLGLHRRILAFIRARLAAAAAATVAAAAAARAAALLRNGRDQLDASMARQLASALGDADLAMLVAEPKLPGDVEHHLMEHLTKAGTSAILALNKVDKTAKNKLLPVILKYSESHPFREIVPVSGLEKDNVDTLLEQIVLHLPEQDVIFPDDMLTDRTVTFLCSEIIREKVFHLYDHEVPYDVAVEIEEYEERRGKRPDLVRAVIYVDKRSQKSLLIGKDGQALKEVGSLAREEIEQMVGRPIYVDLWVKVNPKWRRKAGFIQRTL